MSLLGLLDTRQAAKELSVSVRTMQSWRADGAGPAFIKMPSGLIRYQPEDLAEWAGQYRQTPVYSQRTP